MNDITIDDIDEIISAIHNKKESSVISDLLLDLRLKLTQDN